MGVDFFEFLDECVVLKECGGIFFGVGKGIMVRCVIFDKNICIGLGVLIINKDNVEEVDCLDQGFYICNGIVVVQKNVIIVDGMVI